MERGKRVMWGNGRETLGGSIEKGNKLLGNKEKKEKELELFPLRL